MSVHTLQVPSQSLHLRSPSPPAVAGRPSPQLNGAFAAIDSRSRSSRPGRQISASGRTTTSSTQPLTLSTVCQIRPMMSSDLPAVADLMRDEGWNVDFDNMAAVFEMQPLAQFVAQTMTGRIVGHCSSVCLDDSVGMLSYILVRRQNQKQGLGSQLMKVAKEALGGRIMAFFSVEDAVPFYKSRNFETRRFSALVRDFSLDPRDFADIEVDEKVTVMRARDVDFDKLNEYDSAVQGMDRAEYLKKWILRPSNVAFAALDSDSGDVLGYVSLSFFSGRWDVNPLYADSDDVAMRLLKQASQEVSESIRVFARIPADSVKGIKLFSRLRDTKHHRVLYLMSDKPLPNSSSDKIYSLSTVCYGLK
ncbi:hypothetical protein V1264_013699 [Littorina saxatilis]|uniref:N-acetyltransferase domain-containing protein n=1 Tax=Littorina saxatilis TaxID=31220 RepID=A0AAN9BU03_9CAEN